MNRNFYVDDGLISCAKEDVALEILQSTCTQTLPKKEGNLNLHKRRTVHKLWINFHQKIGSKTLRLVDVDLDFHQIPLQQSLGPAWNSKSDTFDTKYTQNKPYNGTELIKNIMKLISSV